MYSHVDNKLFLFSARRAAKEAKEAPAQPAPVSLYFILNF